MAYNKSAKMESLLKILRLLNSGGVLSAANLAESLKVTERTVYRYITTLQGAGYPIFFDRKKTSYRFIDGYNLTEYSGNNELFQTVDLKSRMTDSLAVGLTSYDNSGQCVVANDAAVSLLGGSIESLLSQNYNDLESWRKSGMIIMAREVMASGVEAHGEFRIDTSFGRKIWGCCSMSRFTHKGAYHLMLVFQDISKLKYTELELRKTQELMRQFLEFTPVYTYIKDADSRPVMLSKNFEIFFNRPLDQIIGKEMAELLPEETARRVVHEDRKVLESGSVFQEDDEIDGRHYSTTKFPIHLESGSYTGGFILDITERKRGEEKIKKKNIEVEQFINTVSHDLRSPLVTMKTFLGYLEKDMAGNDHRERVAQDLQFIHKAADKMESMLNELLEMARISSFETPPVNISLLEVLTEVQDALAGVISERNVEVHQPDTELILIGDRPRLGQIWQNLIENAIKYSNDNGLVRIELGWRQDNGDTVFFVKDNGIGISRHNQGKIFNMFEKLDKGSSGIGIGLPTVKRIVEKYGGRVWVESEEIGKGSCFFFTLPDAVVDLPP